MQADKKDRQVGWQTNKRTDKEAGRQVDMQIDKQRFAV